MTSTSNPAKTTKTATNTPAKPAKKAPQLNAFAFDVKAIQDVMNKLVVAKQKAIEEGKSKSTKNPRLTLTVGDNNKNVLGQIALSVTKTGQYPGCIYICQVNEDKDSAWLYRIGTSGKVDVNEKVEIPTWLNSFLVRFAANPSDVASESGALSDRCCVCNLPLTDDRAISVGYGKVCAANLGWPWGSVYSELTQAVIEAAQPATIDPAVVVETLKMSKSKVRTAKLCLFTTKLGLDPEAKSLEDYEQALSIWLDQVGYNAPKPQSQPESQKVESDPTSEDTPLVSAKRIAEVKAELADPKIKLAQLKSLCTMFNLVPFKPTKEGCMTALENWLETVTSSTAKVEPDQEPESEPQKVESTPTSSPNNFTQIKSENGATVHIGRVSEAPSMPTLDQAKASLSPEKLAKIEQALAAVSGKKAPKVDREGNPIARGLPDYVAPNNPKTTIKAGTNRALLLEAMVKGCTQAEAKTIKDDGVKAAVRYGYGYRFDKKTQKYFLVMPEGMTLRFIEKTEKAPKADQEAIAK